MLHVLPRLLVCRVTVIIAFASAIWVCNVLTISLPGEVNIENFSRDQQYHHLQFHNYLKLHKDCQWRDRQQRASVHVDMQGAFVGRRSLNNLLPVEVASQICLVQANLGEWTVVRVGPFKSTGGNDTLTGGSPIKVVTAHDILAINASKVTTDQVSIAGIMHGSFDGTGTKMLSFPPIRVHHTTFTTASRLDALPYTGSDYPCHRMHGGDMCRMQLLPAGYSYNLNLTEAASLSATGLVIDVRRSNSPLMHHYIEFAHLWLPVATATSLSFFHIMSPIEMIISPVSHHASFWLDPTKSSLLWWQVYMPTDGSMIRIDHHTHHLVDRQLLMFAGDPEAVGLNIDRFVTNFSAKPLILHDVDAVLMRVLQRGQGLSRTRDCTGRSPCLICTNVYKGIEYVGGSRDVVPGLYPRLSPLQCAKRWSFRKGDAVTFVAFMDPIPSQSEYALDMYFGKVLDHFELYLDFVPSSPRQTTDSFWAIGGHHTAMEGVGSILSYDERKIEQMPEFVSAAEADYTSAAFYFPELMWGKRSSSWDC